MNTHRTGMRTVLAAAAAGALIMGSAAGAMAAPATKGKPAKEPYVKIQTVDIHRHSPINLNEPRDLNLRVTVRETDPLVTVTGVKVTLLQYANKSARTPVEGSTLTLTKSDFGTPKVSKKGTTVSFKGSVDKSLIGALDASVAPGTSVLMCISDVDLMAGEVVLADGTVGKSMQTTRRLGLGSKKPVRECVRLFDPSDPVVPGPVS